MSLKKKFGKLGAILLTSASIGFTSFNSAYSQELDFVDAYETEINREKITYLRAKGPYIEFKTNPTGERTGWIIHSYTQTILVVEKPNGKTIVYLDLKGDDLRIDRIGIEENGKETQYDGV